MTTLPITRLTLYKHGVGFFERRAPLEGEEATLSFRVEEMNDILKSLTPFDWDGGQVLGVEYATPQTREERLAGCSIKLSDTNSLLDLAAALRGRRVALHLDQQETLTGTMVGLDGAPQEQPLATTLISLLLDGSEQVATVPLSRLLGVEVLDERGATDLRFFLETSLLQDNFRQVTIRLTPGSHDLAVSYVAPAPTWRVSYRLAADSAPAKAEPQALLLGWGIFDNQLEEDLQGIALSLVAGMPISFVYDLYTPFTPERPVVEEEARVAAAPVEFAQAMPRGAEDRAMLREMPMMGAGMGAQMAAAAMRAPDLAELSKATRVETTTADLGELFQYSIATPVTVGRGQSAMVPIVSARLSHRKDLLYNGSKMPTHPVATLRLKNNTGLTLERGPVTVLEDSQYVGEALLSFTAAGGEIVVPYAVELGAKVREESGARREVHGLRIKGHVLIIEEWDIRWREYQLTNSTNEALTILIEHPRTAQYDLFDTTEPKEKTDEHLRFNLAAAARGEAKLRVQEHRLNRRHEQLQRQSAGTLAGYLKQGLLNARDRGALGDLLALWDKIADRERRLAEIEKERAKVYKAQEQIQGNMKALDKTGKEGTLRASYVDKLEESERRLQGLAGEESSVQAEIAQLNEQIDKKIAALA
jgi:hypothetical protein